MSALVIGAIWLVGLVITWTFGSYGGGRGWWPEFDGYAGWMTVLFWPIFLVALTGWWLNIVAEAAGRRAR